MRIAGGFLVPAGSTTAILLGFPAEKIEKPPFGITGFQKPPFPVSREAFICKELKWSIIARIAKQKCMFLKKKTRFFIVPSALQDRIPTALYDCIPFQHTRRSRNGKSVPVNNILIARRCTSG
jgi:hypothetical protein